MKNFNNSPPGNEASSLSPWQHVTMATITIPIHVGILTVSIVTIWGLHVSNKVGMCKLCP